jgi:predicted nucleotide-binding protein
LSGSAAGENLRSPLALRHRHGTLVDATAPAAAGAQSQRELGDAVFIVHGRAGREYEVAHVVHGLDIATVILAEEINQGSPTLIEKLEREAENCGYAVVLFTPDDMGRLVSEQTEKPRARQNVVFELGYFVAKYGRGCVLLLHDPTVEVPSDFGGIVYQALDNGGAWKRRLERELRAAMLGECE